MVVEFAEIVIPKSLIKIVENNYKEFPGVTNEERKLLKQLDEIFSQPSEHWSTKDHLRNLECLILIEYYHQSKELKKYNLKNQQPTFIRKHVKYYGKHKVKKYLFAIDVPRMNLEDPFVVPGDSVFLNENVLKIVKISSKLIIGEIENSIFWYDENLLYDVSFQLSGYPIKCMLHALDKMSYGEQILSPDPNRQTKILLECQRRWFNLNVTNNLEQRQAINYIINKTARPAPYILFGPPGTGKTATIVETIKQIYFERPDDRILVCTPSNTAADEITHRLINDIPYNDIVRFINTSRNIKTVEESILPCTLDGTESEMSLQNHLHTVNQTKIIISTLVNSMRIVSGGSTNFSYVFIDEAGQATEPETLIPFILHAMNTRVQFILSGDHLQLSPVVKCKEIDQILGVSMMERLMKNELYKKQKGKYRASFITKLVYNYRSHESILKISNKLFYENELIACAKKSSINLFNEKPVLFHEVKGTEEKKSGSHSTFNQTEMYTIMDYLNSFLQTASGEEINFKKYIGIITPFKLQEQLIKQKLQEKKSLSNIEVGTIQKFQGREKPIIIMSTVRSRVVKNYEGTTLGLLTNKKLFNVSLTRAQSLIIVIGNSNVLKEYHSMWNELITFCKEKESFIHQNMVPRQYKIVQEVLTGGYKKIVTIEKRVQNLQSVELLKLEISKLEMSDAKCFPALPKQQSLDEDLNKVEDVKQQQNVWKSKPVEKIKSQLSKTEVLPYEDLSFPSLSKSSRFKYR